MWTFPIHLNGVLTFLPQGDPLNSRTVKQWAEIQTLSLGVKTPWERTAVSSFDSDSGLRKQTHQINWFWLPLSVLDSRSCPLCSALKDSPCLKRMGAEVACFMRDGPWIRLHYMKDFSFLSKSIPMCLEFRTIVIVGFSSLKWFVWLLMLWITWK